MPIERWWETNPATTPRQGLGMVSPELVNPASRVRHGVPGTPQVWCPRNSPGTPQPWNQLKVKAYVPIAGAV